MTKMTDKDITYLSRDEVEKYLTAGLSVDHISTYPKEMKDPNYEYAGVIINYPGRGMKNMHEYLEKGWECVYSTHHIIDTRAFKPDNTNTKEESLRPQLVTKTSSEGYKYVYMRILKTKYQENQQKEAERIKNLKHAARISADKNHQGLV